MDSVLNNKWFELSLVQQMVNIGNEVKRALKCSSDPDKKICFFIRRYSIHSLRWKTLKMPMYCRNYESVKRCWRIIAESISLPAPQSRLADIIRHTNTFCSDPKPFFCNNGTWRERMKWTNT